MYIQQFHESNLCYNILYLLVMDIKVQIKKTGVRSGKLTQFGYTSSLIPEIYSFNEVDCW